MQKVGKMHWLPFTTAITLFVANIPSLRSYHSTGRHHHHYHHCHHHRIIIIFIIVNTTIILIITILSRNGQNAKSWQTALVAVHNCQCHHSVANIHSLCSYHSTDYHHGQNHPTPRIPNSCSCSVTKSVK